MNDAFLKIQLTYVRERYAQLPDDLDRSLAQMNGSLPYQGAFRVRSEQSLVPHVGDIRDSMDRIVIALLPRPVPVRDGQAIDYYFPRIYSV